MSRFRSACAAALLPLLAGVGGCAVGPAPTAPPRAPLQFDFHSAFLMNLHHFLVDAARHPGRIDQVPWTLPPTADETAALHAAVAFYSTEFGKRDLLFDDGLRDIKHALALAGDDRRDARGLGLPPALAQALDRAAPAYARCLWPAQDRGNRDWIARVERLETRYGALIQPRLERIFDARFPASIRDDVVVATGTFTGAYTDAPPPQTVLPSGWPEYDGLAALEMIWHEAAHAGPADHLEETIAAEARTLGREAPENLWHAAQFEAVGTVVADVLAHDGVPGYVEYAEANGVYRRAWPRYVPLLRTQWRPWLQGRGSLGEAVHAMLVQLPPSPSPAT